MNASGSSRPGRRQGFTLAEIVVTVGVFGIVTASIFTIMVMMARQTLAGTSQVRFIARARYAQQKIARYIVSNKYFEIPDTNTISLNNSDNTRSAIVYQNIDGNNATLNDNMIVYQSIGNPDLILCRNVTPLMDGTPMFSVISTTPQAIRVGFHVGDNPNGDEGRSRTGYGYQGVEVRFSATPRNLQLWYE